MQNGSCNFYYRNGSNLKKEKENKAIILCQPANYTKSCPKAISFFFAIYFNVTRLLNLLYLRNKKQSIPLQASAKPVLTKTLLLKFQESMTEKQNHNLSYLLLYLITYPGVASAHTPEQLSADKERIHQKKTIFSPLPIFQLPIPLYSMVNTRLTQFQKDINMTIRNVQYFLSPSHLSVQYIRMNPSNSLVQKAPL